jgi:hypothetical protein
MKLIIVLITLSALTACVTASCPNACSGHGSCGSNDQCSCFRNWVANDCSERVCPYGISHTTTPQGDLNMDGDRYDNTGKAIVYKTGPNAGTHIQAFISHLDNTLTFSTNQDVSSNELVKGDAIQIRGWDATNTRFIKHSFVITAVNADGTFALDKDCTVAGGLHGSVFKVMETIAFPQGTWETWPGDAVQTTQDEGHFYMECSNQGLCDRGTGECECFDGYGGIDCGATSCPNDCSGNGRCLSISDMARAAPTRSGNTIEVARGSHFVSTELTPDVAVGDTVFLGEQADYDSATAYTVTGIVSQLSANIGVVDRCAKADGTNVNTAHTNRALCVAATDCGGAQCVWNSQAGIVGSQGFTVSPRAQNSLPFGSLLYKVGNYNLWDADKVAGCVCDDGFSGHDCSSMACPVGADPLDVTGEDKENSESSTSTATPSTYTKQNERQMLTMDSTRGALSGEFKLTFTSINGEKKTTASIPTAPELSSTVTVSGVEEYDSTYCKEANAGTTTIYDQATGQWGGAACEKLITFSPDLPDDELQTGDYIRIGNEIRQIGSLIRSSDSGNYSSAYVTAQFAKGYGAGTYAYRHSAAKAIEYGLEHLSNDVVGEVTATKSKSSGKVLLNPKGGHTNKLHAAIATGGVTLSFTADGAPMDSVGVGDVLRIHSQDGVSQIETITVANTGLVTGATLDPDHLHTTDDASELVAGTRDIDSITYSVDHVPIVDNGFKYKVKFEDNSGDLPEMICNTDNLRSVYRMDEAAYVTRDEPDRVWFVDTAQGSSQPAYSAVAQADLTHPSAITAGDTIYVGEQRCDVVSSDSDVGSGVSNYLSASVVCAEALSENAHSTADAIVTHDVIEVSFEGSSQSCTSTDRPSLRFIHDTDSVGSVNDCTDASACASVLSYNGANRLVRWSSGSDITKLSTNELMDNNDIAVNDRVSIRTSNEHTYETRTVDYVNLEGLGTTTDNFFTVSQPFTAAYEEKHIYLNFKGTTSSAACSGRGLCDGSTAECQCFKGYTGQACQIQNALAA